MNKKVLLIVMDGWGWRDESDGNAVRMANTPNVDRLWSSYPHTLINGSGTAVGLPDGQMGNSEVGHLNLGAGRVVFQDILRIDRAIADGSFYKNDALVKAMDGVGFGNALHFMGLLSDGGVHSHENHLGALLQMAKERDVGQVYVHAILDGRDTPPRNGVKYLKNLQDKLRSVGKGQIATVVGRYHGMDRDKRWDRIKKAYNLMTSGVGEKTTDVLAAVKRSYDNGITDEFVEPVVVTDPSGVAVGQIKSGDAVIFFNFRADRARQITHALNDAEFNHFTRDSFPKVAFVCMTRYEAAIDLPVVFPPVSRANILAEVAAKAGKTSLRIAETEKYAHVTYFFNGGEEKEYPGEKRILIPSPKVATYDLMPEMSAGEVAATLIDQIGSNGQDYIVCNFANPDMVGHTGDIAAAVTAIETVDGCVGKVIDSLDPKRYAAIVTADHGNADQMLDYVNGGPHTAHTTNLVPCILVDPDYSGSLIAGGALKDIAPTICNYLGIPIPKEMTGIDLRADL